MDRIDAAFDHVERGNFLPSNEKIRKDLDTPIPIGFGQTNSQPTTVRMMLEWLDPMPGQQILDVGSGSGWTTALLAYLVGPHTTVYAVEKIPELVEVGAENCQHAHIQNVRFYEAGPVLGLPEHAPYDRILVSAAAEQLPVALLVQLKIGGRLVIPIEHTIHVIDKIKEDLYEDEEHPGFSFVPLITRATGSL